MTGISHKVLGGLGRLTREDRKRLGRSSGEILVLKLLEDGEKGSADCSTFLGFPGLHLVHDFPGFLILEQTR